MTYCKAIRKIFDPPFSGRIDFESACVLAKEVGAKILNWNDVLWIYDVKSDKWVKTAFLLSDFEV